MMPSSILMLTRKHKFARIVSEHLNSPVWYLPADFFCWLFRYKVGIILASNAIKEIDYEKSCYNGYGYRCTKWNRR